MLFFADVSMFARPPFNCIVANFVLKHLKHTTKSFVFKQVSTQLILMIKTMLLMVWFNFLCTGMQVSGDRSAPAWTY